MVNTQDLSSCSGGSLFFLRDIWPCRNFHPRKLLGPEKRISQAHGSMCTLGQEVISLVCHHVVQVALATLPKCCTHLRLPPLVTTSQTITVVYACLRWSPLKHIGRSRLVRQAGVYPSSSLYSISNVYYCTTTSHTRSLRSATGKYLLELHQNSCFLFENTDVVFTLLQL